MQPSRRSGRMTPPGWDCFSIIVGSIPALARYQAADSPAMPPPTMSVPDKFLDPEFANEFHHGPDMIHGRFRQDAMAEIEDMAGARPSAFQQLMHAHLQLGK